LTTARSRPQGETTPATAESQGGWLRRLTEGVARRLGLDLRALALFRVALGSLVIADVVTRAPNLEPFYTDFGILPVAPYVQEFANRLHISIHLGSGTLGWQVFLFTLLFLCGLALLVGYKTRLATVLGWFLLVSMQNRNPMVLNGGDVLFRMLLFWSFFLPLGARWSVDSALSEPEPERPRGAAGNLLFTGGTMALTMQIFFVYVTTAILKDGKEWWPLGTASFLALSLDSFVTPLGAWMRQWHTLLQYSTYGVYFLELVGPFLLFAPFFYVPLRALTVLAFIGLHLNFELMMRLGLFPWVDMASLIVLFPGELFDWLESRWTTEERKRLTIYYDGDCGFCKKMVYLLREAYLVHETRLAPAQSSPTILATMQRETSWVVVDAAGGEHLRWDALVTTLEHMPLFGGLLQRLPLRRLTPLGDALYRLVAGHRLALGRITAAALPWNKPQGTAPSMAGNVLAVFFTAYVGLWNLKTIPSTGIELLPPWDKIASVLRLDQKWNMFAPYPLKEDGWYVIDGELADGSPVDVLTGVEGPVSFEKPALVAYERYENARWRKYLMNIWSKKKKGHRLYYGKYLCRAWNRDAEKEERKLKKFEIFFMKEYSNPPGEEPTLSRHSIWQHDCFKKSDAPKPASKAAESPAEKAAEPPAEATDKPEQQDKAGDAASKPSEPEVPPADQDAELL
jgi:predicted DCC family thiol-disulfide oxidoreductase YuxK